MNYLSVLWKFPADPRLSLSGRGGNLTLLHFLLGLKTAADDELVAELVVNILKVCPDLLNKYFKEVTFSFLPRAKSTWSNNIKLLNKVKPPGLWPVSGAGRGGVTSRRTAGRTENSSSHSAGATSAHVGLASRSSEDILLFAEQNFEVDAFCIC